jgi:hypothetical protein
MAQIVTCPTCKKVETYRKPRGYDEFRQENCNSCLNSQEEIAAQEICEHCGSAGVAVLKPCKKGTIDQLPVVSSPLCWKCLDEVAFRQRLDEQNAGIAAWKAQREAEKTEKQNLQVSAENWWRKYD